MKVAQKVVSTDSMRAAQKAELLVVPKADQRVDEMVDQ